MYIIGEGTWRLGEVIGVEVSGGGYRRWLRGGGLKLLINMGANRNSEVNIVIEKVISEFY